MEEIRMAYLLLAHKCPAQINIFISQLLNYGDCDIYVHVDKKAEHISQQIIKNENVFIISKYSVSWGSFEIPKSALLLMKMAVESGKIYTHYYFGSCQDLLVKRGMYEFLAKNPNDIFMRINKKIEDRERASARYRVRWPRRFMIRGDFNPYRFIRGIIQHLCQIGIIYRRNEIELPSNVIIYEGRTWFIAPANVIEYIVKYTEENPGFVDFWKDSLASDLMFFQTIIMNSEYKEHIKDELMYVNFGKTFGTWNHPLDITIEDDAKINKGNYFCARKFGDSDIDVVRYFLKKTGVC